MNKLDQQKPTLLQVSLLFSLVAALFLLLGARLQRQEFYSGVILSEILIFALPPVVMLVFIRADLKNVLRLHKISFMNLFLIFWIMVFAIPVVGILNYFNYQAIQWIFGRVLLQDIPVAGNAMELVLNILVIGGSAGVCEEILFRGTILRGYESLGRWRALLLSSLLFGLLHMDFQKLLGTFVLGTLIGFIVYRSNSLWGGMFAHFTNNSLAVLASFFSKKLSETMSNGLGTGSDAATQMAAEGGLPSLGGMADPQAIATLIMAALLVVFCGSVLAGLLTAFVNNTKGMGAEEPSVISHQGRRNLYGLLGILPGLALVGFIYYVQGLEMLNRNADWADFLLKLLGIG